MNQTNLLQKLAPVGVAAFGAISVIGIAAAPAQAAGFTQTSTLEWDNGTSDFVDDVVEIFDEFGNVGAPTSFDVTFSPGSLGGQAAVFFATGDFGPFFTPPPLPQFFDVSGADATFVINSTPIMVGVDLEAEFLLDGPLTFEFDARDASVTATLPDETPFLAQLLPDGSVEFELEDGEWEFVIDPNADGEENIMGRARSSVIEFGQDALAPNGSYAAQGTATRRAVPEPTTILSLLAVGGLGLGLKRKKQA